ENAQHELGDTLSASALECRSVAFFRDPLRLYRHHDAEGSGEQHERSSCGDAYGMSAHEAGGVVGPIALTSVDGLAEQMTSDVVGELLDGAVAMLWFLAHGAQDDGIQIAAQSACKLVDRALACSCDLRCRCTGFRALRPRSLQRDARSLRIGNRSEEHTSELQSRENLVCRLLLEKKN